MWHVLHLIVRPIEALLGLFCVATAVLLFPDQEGRIRSGLEDFWVPVDDYKGKALTTFTVGVVNFENRLLDRLFGYELVSFRAALLSVCLSSVCLGAMWLLYSFHYMRSAARCDMFALIAMLPVARLLVTSLLFLLKYNRKLTAAVLILVFFLLPGLVRLIVPIDLGLEPLWTAVKFHNLRQINASFLYNRGRRFGKSPPENDESGQSDLLANWHCVPPDK
jgi:hypothetical protein